MAAAPPLVARGRGSARDTALGGCLGNNKVDYKEGLIMLITFNLLQRRTKESDVVACLLWLWEPVPPGSLLLRWEGWKEIMARAGYT